MVLKFYFPFPIASHGGTQHSPFKQGFSFTCQHGRVTNILSYLTSYVYSFVYTGCFGTAVQSAQNQDTRAEYMKDYKNRKERVEINFLKCYTRVKLLNNLSNFKIYKHIAFICIFL